MDSLLVSGLATHGSKRGPPTTSKTTCTPWPAVAQPLKVFLECALDLLAWARRACSPLEHRFLRDEHLVEVALHEDDPVALVRRQVEENLGDHLEGLAPCLGQPGRV